MDEAAEVAELFDVVRATVRDDSLDCAEVEGSGAGVRGVGPTDLLLTLFFEVDTGIIEVEELGSRDLPGVWNACVVDLGLVGEEGLDFACELAVGRAKPIDFRRFGVIGVDEEAEKPQAGDQACVQEPNDIYTWDFVILPIPFLFRHPCLHIASLLCRCCVGWDRLFFLRRTSLSDLCS